MTKQPTLEDFVKNYIKNLSRAEGESSFKSWLEKNGTDSAGVYHSSLRDISSDYYRSRSEYGTRAEKLGELGLSKSGYSDYINARALSEAQKRKTDAHAEFMESEAENLKGYENYLAQLEKTEKNKYKDVLREIANLKITDTEEAYKLALRRSVPEELAKLVAEEGVNTNKKALRDTALKTIVYKRYNKSQAHNYALALGLPVEIADELAFYADQLNTNSKYTSDYLEYLKKKWEEEHK